MENKKRLIDKDALIEMARNHVGGMIDCNDIARFPTVDAVELPKGKPGDYLEWNNGARITQMYHIYSVMICEDCIRYDLGAFTPVISHPCIVRILTREEAEAALTERRNHGQPKAADLCR